MPSGILANETSGVPITFASLRASDLSLLEASPNKKLDPWIANYASSRGRLTLVNIVSMFFLINQLKKKHR